MDRRIAQSVSGTDETDSLAGPALPARLHHQSDQAQWQKPYENNDEDWTWLSETAGKAARWLGYIPFERITDNRNAEPVIHHKD